MELKEAHKLHYIFKILCDKFNEDGFLEESPAMLKMYQQSAIDCMKLWRMIYKLTPQEASRAYCIFGGKILIRLSSLINSGRKETQEEFNEWIKLYVE